MTPSNPSPDTEAGTPLPPFELREAIIDAVRSGDGIGGVKAFALYDEWWWDAARPATDPAGLDAAVGRLLGVTGTIAEANARGSLDPKHPYFWADLDAARQAVIAARLSVADGPGPEERPLTHGRHCPCSACAREDWTNPRLGDCGMHGPSCPAVYAPALPVHREDPTDD